MQIVTGQAEIVVGIQKSVAITYLSEFWSDKTESDVVLNDIAEFSPTDFVEDCFNIDLTEPKRYRVRFEVEVSGTHEIEDTDYTMLSCEVIQNKEG